MYSCIQVTLVLILKTSSRYSLKVGRSYLLCECHSFRPLWNTIQSDLTQSEKSDLDLFMNHQVFCIFAQLCQFAFHSPLDSDSLSSVSIFWWTCENKRLDRFLFLIFYWKTAKLLVYEIFFDGYLTCKKSQGMCWYFVSCIHDELLVL